jgi:ribosomal protein S27AE
MSQPHMLCPHCLHSLGAQRRMTNDVILKCVRCGCFWEYDLVEDRWFKSFACTRCGALLMHSEHQNEYYCLYCDVERRQN